MTTQSSQRITTRLARRLADIVAECHYASRRSMEHNTPWVRQASTTARP